MPEIKFLALKVIVVGGSLLGRRDNSRRAHCLPLYKEILDSVTSPRLALHRGKFDYVHRSEFLRNSLALIFNLCDGGDGFQVCHNPRRTALERLWEKGFGVRMGWAWVELMIIMGSSGGRIWWVGLQVGLSCFTCGTRPEKKKKKKKKAARFIFFFFSLSCED